MTANLDRAPPPARTVNRADRVFNPFAARHHSFNLQCLNPIWKRSWQHFGALTQFRCNCPGGGGVQPGMGAGCEGGRCGFLLPASRISTKDTKGHEGKRRRRSQGDDRKSGPCTAAGADWEQGRSSLQPACCAPSFVQFTVSEPDLEEIMAAFRRFDPVQMQLPWRRGGAPGMGAGCEGGRWLPFASFKDIHKGARNPREMTANLDHAAAGADWEQGRSSLQPVCLNPIWKRSWQHFGALTQFRCSPGGGGVRMGAGDRAIRTGNRRGIGRSSTN